MEVEADQPLLPLGEQAAAGIEEAGCPNAVAELWLTVAVL